MNRFPAVFLSINVVVMSFLVGCSSSEETTGNQESKTSAPTAATDQSAKDTQKKSDTLNVDVQNTPKPVYEPKPAEKIVPTGRYSVQVGAYKMADNAERIASLARERFAKNVYTIPDKINDIYKVMVGDFVVKDDARKFRDEMVQKYPSDYKDAWVSDLPQK